MVCASRMSSREMLSKSSMRFSTMGTKEDTIARAGYRLEAEARRPITMLAMASPTLAPSGSSSRLAIKIILAILAALLLIPIAVCGWFYVASHRALPQLDGTVRVPGLSSTVTVVRDLHGVPHITASSMPDLMFAQGYVTAQDRLWEMDMTRRYGNGELAEILGADYVKADRVQRVLGMREVAKRAAADMSAEERALAESYSKGVNAFI